MAALTDRGWGGGGGHFWALLALLGTFGTFATRLSCPLVYLFPRQITSAQRDWTLATSKLQSANMDSHLSNSSRHNWIELAPISYPMEPPQPFAGPSLGNLASTLEPWSAFSYDGATRDSDASRRHPSLQTTNPTKTPSRRSKYGSLDWGGHQSVLKRLYLDENNSLLETMQIMKEQHSFNAS